MQTVRINRPQPIEILCPICGQEHKFSLTVVIDQVIGGRFMMTMHTETVTYSLTCPSKGTAFAIDVPVTLVSGESLVRLK